MMRKNSVQPRILRANEAPSYLGMCNEEFRRTVRPFVSEFPIGVQGVGFDRLELDAWADEYIAQHSVKKTAPTNRSFSRLDRTIASTSCCDKSKENSSSNTSTEKEAFQKALDFVRRKR